MANAALWTKAERELFSAYPATKGNVVTMSSADFRRILATVEALEKIVGKFVDHVDGARFIPIDDARALLAALEGKP